MKFVSLLFAAALTAHATAASPLPPPPVLPYNGPLRPVGTVSAFGASTTGRLAAALADKAHRRGGDSPGGSMPPAAVTGCTVQL